MIQTRLLQGYCFDTSSFIQLKEYPNDVFLTLWANLEDFIQKGLFIAPRAVFEELKQQDDMISRWAKKNRCLFKELDQEQTTEVSNIVRQFPLLVDTDKTVEDADPFLIALAKVYGWTVVTQERPRRSPDAKPKIPDVCEYFNIRSIDVFGFFRECGWTF